MNAFRPGMLVILCLVAITAAAGSHRCPAGDAPAAAVTADTITADRITAAADRSVRRPTWRQWTRVLSLRDHNTRVVVVGTSMLGCAAGVVGGFTLLRRRALLGDALSHATLPGIAIAFIVAGPLGMDGKSLGWLLGGATVSGLAGVAAILIIRGHTRLKEDTALGIVLSVFFGAGVALLGIVQQMPAGNAAGLEAFIFGKTASMTTADSRLIAIAAGGCIAACLLLFKEFKLLCFDVGFAGSEGYAVIGLDLALMTTVVVISIVGLQAVGLILMIALLIVPAAAARFWTERMSRMLIVAGGLGGLSGAIGATASAVLPDLPSGAMIVLTCAFFFLLSLLFGSSRGTLIRGWRRHRMNRTVRHQHLLRAIYELTEGRDPGRAVDPKAADSDAPADTGDEPHVTFAELLPQRSWSVATLRRGLNAAAGQEWITQIEDRVRLTKKGRVEARRLTREHRLWELYLIAHADIAPGQVDRQADRIEHVLEPEMVAELEAMLQEQTKQVPRSPHQIAAGSSAIGGDPPEYQLGGQR